MDEKINGIKADVDNLKEWKGVIEYRVTGVEERRKEQERQITRMSSEITHVDKKVSEIQGGVNTLKWIIPIAISAATAIGSVVVFVVG